MIIVNSKTQAWKLAKRLFEKNCSFELDNNRTERAGYKIYYSTGTQEYICDLGNRLELNYSDGTSENIWINEPAKY